MNAGNRRASRFRRVSGVLALVATLLLALPASAQVELKLDRQRVVEGETVTLTFVTNDPRQSLEADFSALNADFEVIDRRTETQLSIVNGRQTAVVRLLLTVEPLRAGRLEIPAFDFSGARTAPAMLEVAPAPELAPGELPPVFIIPGGTAASAALDVARTVIRRVERRVVGLAGEEGNEISNPVILPWLNRLSDVLFLLARLEEREAGLDYDRVR